MTPAIARRRISIILEEIEQLECVLQPPIPRDSRDRQEALDVIERIQSKLAMAKEQPIPDRPIKSDPEQDAL